MNVQRGYLLEVKGRRFIPLWISEAGGGFFEYSLNPRNSLSVFIDKTPSPKYYLLPTVTFCSASGWTIFTFNFLNVGFKVGLHHG